MEQLFTSISLVILFFVGVSQAKWMDCNTWPSNENGTIITEDGAFYINCKSEGAFNNRFEHECQLRHSDYFNSYEAPYENIYVSNPNGDPIKISLWSRDDVWDNSAKLSYDVYLVKEEGTSISSIVAPWGLSKVRSCKIKGIPKVGRRDPQQSINDIISLDIIVVDYPQMSQV